MDERATHMTSARRKVVKKRHPHIRVDKYKYVTVVEKKHFDFQERRDQILQTKELIQRCLSNKSGN